jgi:hypothetical protein
MSPTSSGSKEADGDFCPENRTTCFFPKRRLIFNWPQGVISQKIEFLITTAVGNGSLQDSLGLEDVSKEQKD